jgi:hypothetical protein
VICYNSAVVTVHQSSQPQLARQVPGPIECDAYYLVDVDGHISDYGDSPAHPITVGDRYFKETISVDPISGGYYEPSGTFLPIIGVAGTVSCPSWTSNNLYMYLFHENPFTAQNVDPAAQTILTAPGAFVLPCLSNDSVFVLGLWDADGSGDDGGPTPGDLIGAYGVPVDGSLNNMTRIATSTLSTSGKNFTIWYENTPQLVHFTK